MSTSQKKWGVGAPTSRPDGAAKAAGHARYLSDIKIPRTLYATMVVSDVAPAKIKRLDIGAARALEGVHAVLTAEALADRNQIGTIVADQPLLADNEVRMVGERLALIAAEDPKTARGAAARVEVELEPQPGVYDVEQALSPAGAKVHGGSNLIKEFKVEKGTLDEAKTTADVCISHTYRIGGQEHAYLEGQGCLAVPAQDGGLTVYSSTQCPAYVRARICAVTRLQHADVRVIQTVTGGAFGGKEDYPDEPACCAALLALETGRPVKLCLERGLDFQVSTKRHRMVIEHTIWANRKGRLLAADINILVDAGAYTGMSTVVAERANISSLGPYAVDTCRVSTKVVYTNNLFGGPFRGFGAPQVTAAIEAQLNALAAALDLNPVEVRKVNMVSTENPYFVSGQKLKDATLCKETLQMACETAHWRKRWCRQDKAAKAISPQTYSVRFREGMGVASTIYGANLHHGGQRLDRGGAYIIVQPDATINVYIGNTEMGQGALAACRAIASEALGVVQDRIRVGEADTAFVPDSGPTVASRGTQVAGRAIVDGAATIMERFKEVAAHLLGDIPAVQIQAADDRLWDPVNNRQISIEKVVAELYARRISPFAVGWFRSPDRTYDPETGMGAPYDYYCFATHIARVRVDTWTGRVKVVEVTAAHDVGRVVHPSSLEGQIQGGVTQAVGWSTLEEFVLHKGVLMNRGFTDYLIPTATDAPTVNIRLVEKPEPHGPFGAKGIGEPSFIPCGGAVLGAVSNALGIHICEMPLTPERVRAAIVEAKPEDGYLKHLGQDARRNMRATD
jgi:CO/xanthine dehydrogenase Mo-binding subunit